MKKYLLFILFFIDVTFGYSQSFSSILCLPFNGNAQDNTGSHDGIIYGATLSSDRFGNPNSAYSFNGVNSYIEIPGFGNFIDSNETTISIWCKTNIVKSQCLFMLNPDITTDRFMGLVYYSHNGVSSTIFDHGDLFTDGRIYLETPYESGWEHYVFVSSKALNLMRIYKNGKKIGEATQNSPIRNHNRNLYIGGGHEENTSGFFYDGLIDDFQIFNKALTSTQVMELFDSSSPRSEVASVTSQNFKHQINSYPNPTNGLLKIETDFDNIDLEITDFLGNKVFESRNTKNIDIRFLEKGIYFLTVKSRENLRTQKIIITD